MTTDQDNLQTLLNAGAAAAQPVFSHGGKPYVTVPDGYNVHDLEHLLPKPARKRGTVKVTDAQSFIGYTKKHGSLDECTIYADIDPEKGGFKLTGVIDDHGSDVDAAQWRDHRCVFAPQWSVEWKRWSSKDKAPFSQAEFASWLEDNLGDIAGVDGMPSGADILQMALGFEAHADKRLLSKINLQSGGVQLEFVDDETKDTRSRMQMFERFTLGLPVFYGSENAYTLQARLKYRQKDNRPVFFYELIRPDRVFQSAVADELTLIRDATGFPFIYGTP